MADIKPLDPPLKRIKSSYIPREPEQTKPIPKLEDSEKKPRKKVRRKLDRSYQSKHVFLRIVEEGTRRKFIKIRPTDEMPYFWEFEDDEGIEVLLEAFRRLPREFQDSNEIRRFFASRWKGEDSELHAFLIAAGVWKFIVLHCEDVESDDGQAEEIEQETQDGQVGLPATIDESEDPENVTTNGAKELDLADETIKAVLEAANKAGADISKAVLDADPKKRAELSGHRKKAVELWQQQQQLIKKPHTHVALFKRRDKSEFYKWLRGELPVGSSTDLAIKRVLLESSTDDRH